MDRNLAVWAVEHAYQVALRKESVDRNRSHSQRSYWYISSLSARRAWIEIVDPDADTLTDDGRSPQGERG